MNGDSGLGALSATVRATETLTLWREGKAQTPKNAGELENCHTPVTLLSHYSCAVSHDCHNIVVSELPLVVSQ